MESIFFESFTKEIGTIAQPLAPELSEKDLNDACTNPLYCTDVGSFLSRAWKTSDRNNLRSRGAGWVKNGHPLEVVIRSLHLLN